MDKSQWIKELIEKYGENATLKQVLEAEQLKENKQCELHPIFGNIIAGFKAAMGM